MSRAVARSDECESSIRLNYVGQFQMPATRVEATDAPEIFGETPNAVWSVRPGSSE